MVVGTEGGGREGGLGEEPTTVWASAAAGRRIRRSSAFCMGTTVLLFGAGVLWVRTALKVEVEADPSTALRSGRDDNVFGFELCGAVDYEQGAIVVGWGSVAELVHGGEDGVHGIRGCDLLWQAGGAELIAGG